MARFELSTEALARVRGMSRPLMLFPEPHKAPRPRPPRPRWGWCADCKVRMCIPVEHMPNGYGETPEGEPAANIACSACGQGWHVDGVELDRVWRKELAEQRREALEPKL